MLNAQWKAVMTYEIARAVTENVAARAEGRVDVIDIRPVTDKGEWDALVASCPDPHLPQSFAYGEGKAATGWTVGRMLLLADGRPVALATVLELRRFGIRLMNRINRGPLFLTDAPVELMTKVYAALRRRWRPLLIAPAMPAGVSSRKILRTAGYVLRHERSWRSGRIDLTKSEDELWAGFTSGFRNRARNAEKGGARLRLAVDDASFEWMLARHEQNMAEKGFSAASPALLRALRRTAPEDVLVFQLVHGGTPVAGMSVVRFGQVAEYHIGWFGSDGRKLNAGNFLMWHAMREMKRRGARTFDVGGLKPGDGYTRFKRMMNPVEYELAGEWMSF